MLSIVSAYACNFIVHYMQTQAVNIIELRCTAHVTEMQRFIYFVYIYFLVKGMNISLCGAWLKKSTLTHIHLRLHFQKEGG